MTDGIREERASRTIAVLGSCSVDLVVTQSRLPRPGETIFGDDFRTVPGGKGLNQALAAARAGGEVAFLGAVGRDAYGAQVRACLSEAGVRIDALESVDGPTGTAHISVLEGGENAIVFVAAANNAITHLDGLARDLVAGSGYLVTQFERPLPLIMEALHTARASDVRTIVTPSPVVPVGTELLALTDILVPNEVEARELVGLDDEVEAAKELSRVAGMVILTRGERGAVVVEDGRVTVEIPARPVSAIDTTAAGDTFVGILVAKMALGATLGASLTAAAVGASIAVTRPGASASIPTRVEIDEALEEHLRRPPGVRRRTGR